MRLSALSTRFLRFFASRGASQRSIETYEAIHGRYTAFLIGQGLADDIRHFTPDLVEAFATAETERGMKSGTVGLALAALHSLGQYGARTKDTKGCYILAENPVSRVYRPKRERPPEKYLSLDELRALLATPTTVSERLAMDMIVDTACRASEQRWVNRALHAAIDITHRLQAAGIALVSYERIISTIRLAAGARVSGSRTGSRG